MSTSLYWTSKHEKRFELALHGVSKLKLQFDAGSKCQHQCSIFNPQKSSSSLIKNFQVQCYIVVLAAV